LLPITTGQQIDANNIVAAFFFSDPTEMVMAELSAEWKRKQKGERERSLPVATRRQIDTNNVVAVVVAFFFSDPTAVDDS